MSLFSVNTNLGALAALQALNANQEDLTAAQNAVSTGKKVAVSSDNPAIYSIANSINANIAGLSAVSDSLNFGASIISTSSTAITDINTVLSNLQQTVTSSGQTGLDLNILQQSVKADLSEINQYASQATFNGVNLLNPTVAAGNTGVLNVVQGLDGSVYTVTNQGTSANVGTGIATTLTDALGITNLDVSNPGFSVTFDNTLSLGSFSSAVTGSTLTSPANASLQLVTGTGATAHTYSFEFTDANGATTTSPTLQTAENPNTTIVAIQIDTSTQSTNQIVGALINSVRGAGFSVQQNTDGSLDLSGSNLTTATFGNVNAGVFTADTGTDVTTAALSSNTGATTTSLVQTIQAAIKATNVIAANLGAAGQQITGIQNFTSALSSALTAGVGALTDADLAAESAKLTSLQTKQQLATQSLSIANKQPQSLLTLFQGL